VSELNTKHFEEPDETISLPGVTVSVMVLNETYFWKVRARAGLALVH
jgi:hypothetical protein